VPSSKEECEMSMIGESLAGLVWNQLHPWMILSRVRGEQCSDVVIEFWCSDLAQDDLTTLLVWVDKENSMEFLLNFLHYLYNYCMVYVLSSHGPHVT